jgi:cytochrome c oxidase cbb3-type subunit III
MSGFWSGWVIVLLVLNLGLALFLFVWAQIVKIPTEPDGTTGHVWAHGVLREGVRNLPLWWALASAGALIFGLIYFVLYPGFGGLPGVLGWTSTQQLEREIAANDAKLNARMQSLGALSLEELAVNPDAARIGHRLYLDNCAACHGPEALGNHAVGAPDLTDAEWLYGGDAETFMASILDGRRGVMPPWGPTLGHEGVNQATAYVLSLSGTKAPTDWIAPGKARYDALCIACHGADGRGNPALGAPNLTDRTWLYGGDFASIAKSIRDGRNGVMPGWRTRLTDNEVRLIAAWVRGHGRRSTP